jgi:LysR family glycine cleavage system transcriptional activator
MREAMLPLASLQAFVLLAEHGSLAAVAARLNVTQPAVSKRLRQLEAHLGVVLVQRGANSLTLTAAGRDYAAALSGAFDAMHQATRTLGARSAGPLRVCAYTTWAMRWLIPRLPQFRARHPGQEVEVTTSVKPVDFSRDPVDVAIRALVHCPVPHAVPLQTVDVLPCVAPSLSDEVRRHGLRNLTLLGSKVTPEHWGIWTKAAGVSLPGSPLLFESTSLAIQAALEGMGAVIAPLLVVQNDLRDGRLVSLATEAVPTGERYWLILPTGSVRRQAHDFCQWLLEEIAVEAACDQHAPLHSAALAAMPARSSRPG